MKRLMMYTVAIALLLSVLGIGAAAAQSDEAVLTLMVYITGSDLESMGGAATADITEMMRSSVDTDKVNIILCTGGARTWKGGFPNDRVCIYRVAGRRPEQLDTLGEVSMGSADTLSRFLDYSYEHFKASQYALILWDHGGGPMNGVCYDELFYQDNAPDCLDMAEMKTALGNSPFGNGQMLEWIGFDACLMSSVETAFCCAPYAKYMIASQETEPGSGWNYQFLQSAEQGLSGAEIGKLIVDSYVNEESDPNLMLTLSLTDLSKIKNVETAMDDLFADLSQMLSPESFSAISNGRRDAKSFGRSSTASEYDLVDLLNLAQQYEKRAPDKVAALQDAARAAVVYNGSNQPNANGLSVYYPYYNKEYYTRLWKAQYDELSFAKQYYGFMDSYAGLWLGEQLADWTDVKGAALPPLPTQQEITLTLTQQQLEHYAYSELYIITETTFTEPYYYHIGNVDDVTLDEQGVLHAQYNYRSLYVVDEQGNPLSDALTYTIVDGMYLLRANLTDKTRDEYYEAMYERIFSGDEDFDLDSLMNVSKVYLQCKPNEAGDGLDVVGIIDLGAGVQGMYSQAEGLYMGKQVLTLDADQWNWIGFLSFPRRITYDENGNVLPFVQWYNPNDGSTVALSYEEIDNKKPWSLRFVEKQHSGLNQYAQYLLHDTQGNLVASELLPIQNPNLSNSSSTKQEVFANENVSITYDRVDITDATFDDGLFFYFTMHDAESEMQNVNLIAQNVVLNRYVMIDPIYMLYRPDGDGSYQLTLNVLTEDLAYELEDKIETLQFDLVIRDASTFEDLYNIPVSITPDADISAIHSASGSSALAQTEKDGLVYRVNELTEQHDGSYRLGLFVQNNREEETLIDIANDLSVNGYMWAGVTYAPQISLRAGHWTVFNMVINRAEDELMIRSDEIPIVDYLHYWGIQEIERLGFINRNVGYVELALDKPYIPQVQPVQAVSTGSSEQAEPTAAALLESDSLRVTLRGFAYGDNGLTAVVDLSNLTAETMEVDLQRMELNGVECSASLRVEETLFSLHAAELQAMCTTRAAVTVKEETAGMFEQPLDTLALRFEYLVNAKADAYYTPAQVRFLQSTLPADLPLVGESLSGLEVETSKALNNDPIDPVLLFDSDISMPENPLEYAVTLRMPLTREQLEQFDGAQIMLLVATPELWQVGYLNVDVTLDEQGCAALAPFSGHMACIEGAKYPAFQHIYLTKEGTVFDIRVVELFTDSVFAEGIDIQKFFIRADFEQHTAAITEFETEQQVGRAQTVEYMECLAMPYTYNQQTMELERTSNISGEGLAREGGKIKLYIRPATDFDMQIAFQITNKDGSVYTLLAPYADIVSEATWR